MRGSKDGLSKDVFKKLCYVKGPILIVAQTENNRVFGGFTSFGLQLDMATEFHPYDSKSFIFSLNEYTICK
jgi:hypothetical protein